MDKKLEAILLREVVSKMGFGFWDYLKLKYDLGPGHWDVLVCQCGCEEKFVGHWSTMKPKYKNRAHRMRAYRARRAARQGSSV